MCKQPSVRSRQLLVLFTFLAGFAGAEAAGGRVAERYGKLPLHFEANRGQTHEDVRFLARGSGYSLYLTPGEAVFVLAEPDPDKKRDWHGKRDWRNLHERPKARRTVVLRMAIEAANPRALSGQEELPGKANYIIGNDPAKWRTNVPTYAKVHYRGVYPGIDLVYYGNQRQLEYDFIVAPGADPGNIVLDFQGADRLEINTEGELVLHLAGGALRQKKPLIYQEVDGIRREIAGGYIFHGANRVGFQMAAYDRSRPLVIDPVLSYSTYLGGNSADNGIGIGVDVDGNAYVTGSTHSINFPTTVGAFQTTCAADQGDFFCPDVFVAKLNPGGSALVYSTYLGGSDFDHGARIAVDADGNAYVTGQTFSTNFPTTAGAFQPTSGGGTVDGFVTKLNPAGSALAYSTYLGGSGGEGVIGVAVDTGGNAYVSGSTNSTDFPMTAGAFQTTNGGGTDGFVTKLNTSGSALAYSTYLGGSGGEGVTGIAVDADGNAYVTGHAVSIDFPTTAGAFQTTNGGGTDGFVTKLNPTGSALVYSTYLGGNDRDAPAGIAVDADDSAYVTGQTFSIDFPTTAGALQTIFGGGEFDAFVTKLNPTGSAFVYSTFLGGSADELGSEIALNAIGNAYVTGFTASTNFPTTAGALQTIFGGGESDAYFTMLNPTGSTLVYSTFLGGSDIDRGNAIAVDADGNAYLTGLTYSSNFPTTAGAIQTGLGGGEDAFVAKFDNAATRFEESAASYTGNWTSYGAETGTFSGGTVLASANALDSASFSFTGSAVTWIGVRCSVCGIATVSIDGGVPVLVDTAGPASSNLTSEPVFSASGLDPAVSHTMVITVTGVTTSVQGLPFAHVAVDAFDVTR